jgi:leucyl aminopeptidase
VKYEAYSGSPVAQRADCLVVGAFDDRTLGELGMEADRSLKGALTRLLRRGDFSGKSGETLLLPEVGRAGRSVLLVGLGSQTGYQRRAWRKACTSAITALARTRLASATLALERPSLRELGDTQLARAGAELCGATLYRINDLKSGRKPRAPALATLRIGPFRRNELAAARRALAEGAGLADSAALLKDLANLPGNVCTPRYLANAAVAAGRASRGLKVRVLNEAQIRRLKMGCFLAVTQGSAEPPRFIIMEWNGGKRGAAPVVLVGKGITFDTGGISLKDPAAMDEMKYDMCGAATVIAALQFAAAQKLKLNVVGLVPTCENMPSSTAIKPGDIVTSASGQTVEILNTDAEGRLILCDALNYARRYRPDCVIDIATLTGACLIALGRVHSGLLASDQPLADELLAAGLAADDRAWQLPLTDEYGEMLRSNFADMANVAGREAGTITAAAFLAKYTQGMKWAHLDIAGSAWVTGNAKSATARPLPLLTEFLSRRATR